MENRLAAAGDGGDGGDAGALLAHTQSTRYASMERENERVNIRKMYNIKQDQQHTQQAYAFAYENLAKEWILHDVICGSYTQLSSFFALIIFA